MTFATPNPARHGGGFISFVVGVLVIAAVVVLGWGVFSNWNRDADADGHPDGFSLRVLDPAWWDASKRDAQPLVAQARDWALERKEQIWGEGGYLDQGETWLQDWEAQRQQRKATPQTHNQAENSEQSDDRMAKQQTSGLRPQPAEDPTGDASAEPTTAPPPAAATAASRSPATLRLEERIQAAEEHFAKGLEDYRSADPALGWTEERKGHYDKARQNFLQVRRILVEDGVVDNYAAMDDHDPLIAKKAGELAQLNQKLLYDATKSSGGI